MVLRKYFSSVRPIKGIDGLLEKMLLSYDPAEEFVSFLEDHGDEPGTFAIMMGLGEPEVGRYAFRDLAPLCLEEVRENLEQLNTRNVRMKYARALKMGDARPPLGFHDLLKNKPAEGTWLVAQSFEDLSMKEFPALVVDALAKDRYEGGTNEYEAAGGKRFESWAAFLPKMKNLYWGPKKK
jgi:hypothetical protein